MEYVKRIPALIEKYSGKYIVQGVEPIIVQSADNNPQRTVVLEFPTMDIAKAFLAERETTDLHEIWGRTTNSRILLVEGSS